MQELKGNSMKDIFSIDGKVIVITGGGGVLCGNLAEKLAGAGAKVVLLDIDEKVARKKAEGIIQKGCKALALACDVLNRKSVQKACDKVIEKFGTVDVLINGAGGNKKEATTSEDLSFFDIPDNAVNFVFNLNFIGTIIVSQIFGKVMADKTEGIILNVSSMNAFRPLTKIPAYSAAKAAVSNFTQWLAVHMCHNYSTDIRVNAIAPGFFLTEQNRFLLIDEKSVDLTARGQQIIDHTPMARFGSPEDLDGCVRWLLSDASKFVTGIVVPIDGGFSAYSGV